MAHVYQERGTALSCTILQCLESTWVSWDDTDTERQQQHSTQKRSTVSTCLFISTCLLVRGHHTATFKTFSHWRKKGDESKGIKLLQRGLCKCKSRSTKRLCAHKAPISAQAQRMYFGTTPGPPERQPQGDGKSRNCRRKGKALWDHQHQGELRKSLPPNILLGTCNAGAAPRDKSLLRGSFWIPDEVSVTATTVPDSPLLWRGANRKQADSPRRPRQAAAPCEGRCYPPGKSNRAGEKRCPQCNPGISSYWGSLLLRVPPL